MRPRTATVLLSGGIDSAALMAFFAGQNFLVDGLFIDYGQVAASPERAAAERLAARYGWHLNSVDVRSASNFGSGELLGRNAFLVFAALFFTKGATDLISLGLHSGTSYYDCSEGFVKSAARLVAEHTDSRINVVAPFVSWTKRDVYSFFCEAGLDLELTYSCENGVLPECGTCSSCRDRQRLRCSPKDVR